MVRDTSEVSVLSVVTNDSVTDLHAGRVGVIGEQTPGLGEC